MCPDSRHFPGMARHPGHSDESQDIQTHVKLLMNIAMYYCILCAIYPSVVAMFHLPLQCSVCGPPLQCFGCSPILHCNATPLSVAMLSLPLQCSVSCNVDSHHHHLPVMTTMTVTVTTCWPPPTCVDHHHHHCRCCPSLFVSTRTRWLSK